MLTYLLICDVDNRGDLHLLAKTYIGAVPRGPKWRQRRLFRLKLGRLGESAWLGRMAARRRRFSAPPPPEHSTNTCKTFKSFPSSKIPQKNVGSRAASSAGTKKPPSVWSQPISDLSSPT